MTTLLVALSLGLADPPKPTRSILGDAVGVVTAISATEVSVKFSGVVAIPGSSSGGSSRGGKPRLRSTSGKVPKVKLKAVEETVTYQLPPDLTVSRLGSKDKLTAKDVTVGVAVQVHVVRETTRVPGSPPEVAILATRLTLDKLPKGLQAPATPGKSGP